MTHPSMIERITRSLAYMLRHQPEKFELELDRQGWGEVGEVIRALNEKLGEPVEEEDLRNAITAGDRPRYEIRGNRVRALYGHSIEVEPGETSKPPELLYVGIASGDTERARKHGLRGGRRRFLHLARSIDDAREAGKRTGREYSVLTVFALDAWEEGVNFYDRQALFLAEEVPTQFIEIEGSYRDGYDAPERGDGRPDRARGMGRSGPGPSRGGRGEGRRDGRGRGPRREGGRFDARSDRPVRDEAPRREGRPHPADGPQREERTSSDRGQRPRAGDPGRREVRAEDRAGPRSAPRADEGRGRPAPERVQPAAAPSGSGGRQERGSFGLGVFEAPTPVQPARPAAESSAKPEPKPEPKPERDPAPKPETKPEAKGSNDLPFGAGI